MDPKVNMVHATLRLSPIMMNPHQKGELQSEKPEDVLSVS